MLSRIAAKIDVRGPDECWPWTGGVDKDGYGMTSVPGRRCVRAHRYVYEVEVAPIPAGMDVLHRCDNPPCCNPAHLLPGTNADNVADMIAKGRTARGERNGNARLTDTQVAEIRAAWVRRESQMAIARRYGVSQQTVSGIVRFKSRIGMVTRQDR